MFFSRKIKVVVCCIGISIPKLEKILGLSRGLFTIGIKIHLQ